MGRSMSWGCPAAMPRMGVCWGPRPGHAGLTTGNSLPCVAMASQCLHRESTLNELFLFLRRKNQGSEREGASVRPRSLEGADLLDSQVPMKQHCVPGHFSLV